MGLPLEVSLIIIESTKNSPKNKVLCLGKQFLGFSVNKLLDSKKKYGHTINLDCFSDKNSNKILTQEEFFNSLGFKTVDTLDVDSYEGANIIFDLNNDECPKNLINQYDFIYDGGTLEHVFNIGIALKNLSKFLKKQGVVFHSNPCNGYIDHGFYQISPTLYFDYYLRNEFEIVSCVISDRSIGLKTLNINQDLYRTYSADFALLNSPKSILNFSAKKSQNKENYLNPQQGYYLSKWEVDNIQGHYNVSKKVHLHNYDLMRSLYFFIMTIPFKIIRFFKSFS